MAVEHVCGVNHSQNICLVHGLNVLVRRTARPGVPMEGMRDKQPRCLQISGPRLMCRKFSPWFGQKNQFNRACLNVELLKDPQRS